jgi:methyl-accepting chemotaxis protein
MLLPGPRPGRLAARLLLLDLLGLCVEGAAIAVPAYLLYGVRYGGQLPGRPGDEVHIPGTEVLYLGALALRPVLLAVLLFSVAYAVWQQLWLRRLRRTCPADPVGHLNALASRLPRHSLLVRPLLWALCGLASLGWLLFYSHRHGHGLTLPGVLPVFWLFALNPLLCGALHSLAYDRLLWGGAWADLPDRPDELRRFAGRYTTELGRATLLCTAVALLCTIGFVPFNLEQFQLALRYLPLLLLLLLLIGYRYGSHLARPIRVYLHAFYQGLSPEKAAPLAYRAAQSLPYRLAAAMIVASLSGSLVLIVLFRPLLALPAESVLLVLGITLSVTAATSLYVTIWHRYTLRDLLAHLERQSHLPPAQIPPALPLTTKMVYAFGLPVLCVCLLSLLWSFAQYKTLANRHIQRLAGERLHALLGELRKDLRVPGTGGDPVGKAQVLTALRRQIAQTGIGEECLIYYLPEGEAAAIAVGHPEGVSAPALPPYPLSHLRLRQSGHLDLPRLLLTGEYERVPPDLGAVAVLYPNYRHPGLRTAEKDPLRGQLLGLFFFFVVLIFVSGGIVVIAAVDLSRPVRYLERRAAAMAEGDLLLPVVQTAVEVDEVGRLTFAFEEMRRGLSEMLRSSTELNLQLEAEVGRRAAELSRRNQEVSDAMNRLQLMRGELLRTEKLATMGRIAAEVTSEINNPVNVMATMTDPITEELDELARLSGERPLDRGRIRESVAELRKMLDVLHRGAQRAKEIVRATRIYARMGDTSEGRFDLNQAVDEVLQLFSELPRYGVTIMRDFSGAGSGPEALQVVSVRGNLGQLLSSWLAQTTPRLRDLRGGMQVSVATKRLLPEGGPACAELTISDNGPPLSEGQLASVRQGGVAACFGADLIVCSGSEGTRLVLRLPLA